jgi:hypothetical protein
MARIGVHDCVEESMEGATKLHGIGWALFLHGLVGATPRVMVDEAITALLEVPVRTSSFLLNQPGLI